MKKESFMSRFAQRIDLNSEPLSGNTLIELVDDRWVLIEKHCGVIGYTREKITVKTRKGCVWVQGVDMQLSKMSKEQLKIHGIIRSIKFCGRE